MEQLYDTEAALSSPGYYAVIPADVRYDDQLPANAKLLYGEISALVGKEGYCFATNQYFAKLYKITDRSVTRLVILLEKAGYIRREVEKDESGQVVARKIFLNLSAPDGQGGDNIVTTPRQNCQEGGDKNVRDINRNNNINNNKKTPGKRASLSQEQLREIFKSWIASIAPECWTRRDKNLLYLALDGFYQPRATKKQEPARTEASFKALSNRLLRYSSGSVEAMMDMLERATNAGWKSVYPLRDAPEPEQAQGGDEEWL